MRRYIDRSYVSASRMAEEPRAPNFIVPQQDVLS